MLQVRLLRLILVLVLLLVLNPTSLAQKPTTTLLNPILQEHVDRFIEILNGADVYTQTEYEERFVPFFVVLVPLKTKTVPRIENLQDTANNWQVVQILNEPTANAATLQFAPEDTGDPLHVLNIKVDHTSGKVNRFSISRAKLTGQDNSPSQTMQDVVDEIKAMGHNFNYLVAQIEEGSTECSVLAGEGFNTPTPIASMSKLWVLDAVVKAINEGKIRWDQLVVLTEEDRCLPTGIVQDDPPGSSRTVQELAELMISISDNTATGLLLRLVGRSAVEQAQIDCGHHKPGLNQPFMTTKELYILKLDGAKGDGQPGGFGKRYIEGKKAERRDILNRELMNADIYSYVLDSAAWNGGPIAIEELEWFASPMDLCKVLAKLYQDEEAARILSIEAWPGIWGDKGLWTYIGYKGGSEPGVLGLAWYLVPADATRGHRVVTGTLWNPDHVIDENQGYSLMGTLRDMSWSEDLLSQTDDDMPANPTSLPTFSTPFPTLLLPSSLPTVPPTTGPSVLPTFPQITPQPSPLPTVQPSHLTLQLTSFPSLTPTEEPTLLPTPLPSLLPTILPTPLPSSDKDPNNEKGASSSASSTAWLRTMTVSVALMLFSIQCQTG